MKNIKLILTLILVGCMILGLCACGGTKVEDTTVADTTVADAPDKVEDTTVADTTEAAKNFKVTIVDGEGNAVPGVIVQICKDACVPARADDNGVATFNLAIEDGHKLSVMSCPEGYEYTGEAQVYLEEGATEYTLEISKVG